VVTTVFVLSASDLSGNPIAEPKRLSALPIRVGRNGLNDFVINHVLVSSFHARIEDIDGRLCITDLNSKNRVWLSTPGGLPRPIPPNTPIDLQPGGFEFHLGAHVRAKLTFSQSNDLNQRGMANFTGHVVGNVGAMARATEPPPAAGHVPLAAFPGAPAQALPGGPAGGRAATGALSGFDVESMALLGLKELAASLVPGVPLASTGDIARFITKLHDTIDAFCRSFIPLREGHSQFVSSFDLQRALRRSQQRSQAYLAVEGARTPEELAAALLNPTDRALDAPQAVEGILADLMLHQLALLEGVMRGVRALLEELSPDNIESQASAGPLSLGRHRALWSKYRELFEGLSEERQAFSVIFGPEFTAAYRQYRADGGKRD